MLTTTSHRSDVIYTSATKMNLEPGSCRLISLMPETLPLQMKSEESQTRHDASLPYARKVYSFVVVREKV
jgi:hypothetical protein